ncbi:hypothetical protein [Vibrio diabolicus]|uniref:hypothetical protein n=1 Tax=Vibrio diabolicus TaxID=50719 RepID=UPI00215F6DE7|nr:hypothetical protein [Vibrio diabolicus]MCS0418804.1 hypothetical protein [Vibrio diabolicus]
MELLALSWSPLVAKTVLALWFASENQFEIAVLSQVNHEFVVKHNKQFKRDSQRLAFLLLLQVKCLWHNTLSLGGSVAHPLIGR